MTILRPAFAPPFAKATERQESCAAAGKGRAISLSGPMGGEQFFKIGKIVNLNSFSHRGHREHRDKFSQHGVLGLAFARCEHLRKPKPSSTGAELSAPIVELTERGLFRSLKKEDAEVV